MLIDISKDEYIKFLKDKKANVKDEISEFIEAMNKRLTYTRPEVILNKLDWLNEKKKEISEIDEKIDLLRITNE